MTKGPGGRPTREASAVIADEVLDVAWRLFVAQGFKQFGLDVISREASVAKRTIYNRFGSKEGLLEALIGRAFTRWALQAEVVESQATEGDWLKPLLSYILDVMSSREVRALTAFMLTEGRTYPNLMLLRAKMHQDGIAALTRDFRSRIENYPNGEQGAQLSRSILALLRGWADILETEGAPAGGPAEYVLVQKDVVALLMFNGCRVSPALQPET